MQIEGVSISLKRIRRRALYAYQGIECILPLRGQLTVERNGCSFLLETDHVLVLNNGELHAFSGDENHDILFLQISDGFLLRSCEELLTHPITCCSANDKEQERYYQIKRILTQMLFLAMKEEKTEFLSLLFRLLNILRRDYSAPPAEAPGLLSAVSGVPELENVLLYLNHNYQERLTLADMAAMTYLSPQSFSKLFHKKVGMGFLAYLAQVRAEAAASKLLKFADLIDGLRRAGTELALPEVYDAVCDQTGYVKALEEKNDMESRGRIENVQELKSNILGFLEQQPEDATLSGFLNEIALYTDLDSVEASDDCVTMMTIHSAKGLEFPVVYVVGMEEGIFPGASAQYDQEELEEERRLCYVAMTRAKEKLTLTNCRQRMLYGRTSANRASRFLEEIPEENMRWESKPEPRFGGMEHDGTFGGDRYEDGWGSSPARAGGSWSSGGVHSYRAPAQAPQRPLASVRQASSARKNAAPAAPLLQLQQGDMVEHTAFGKGMVLSVRPMGGDALAEVAFDTVGKKKLMLKSAGAHMRKL